VCSADHQLNTRRPKDCVLREKSTGCAALVAQRNTRLCCLERTSSQAAVQKDGSDERGEVAEEREESEACTCCKRHGRGHRPDHDTHGPEKRSREVVRALLGAAGRIIPWIFLATDRHGD
jgi:hypothetical protein